MQTLSENRRAPFDYSIEERLTAGIELTGQEVKSIKLGRMQIAGSFAIVRGGECFLVGSTIPAYQPKNAPGDYDPSRTRRLLLTKDEIKHIGGLADQKGWSIIPLSVYEKHGLIKINLGVARAKKLHDKRESLKEKAVRRDVRRELE